MANVKVIEIRCHDKRFDKELRNYLFTKKPRTGLEHKCKE